MLWRAVGALLGQSLIDEHVSALSHGDVGTGAFEDKYILHTI